MVLTVPRLLLLLPTTSAAGGSSGRAAWRGALRCASTAAAQTAAASPQPPSSPSSVGCVRWGWTSLQGARSEMEDDVILVPQPPDFHGFSFAAVLDGHAGVSSVEFLRDRLYEECASALQGGSLLAARNLEAIKHSLERAFMNIDQKLLSWLETKEDDSGATATAIFVRSDLLVVSHIGDSSVVISRHGRAQVLSGSHRPYGRSSLEEIKRIRAAGGWIVDGRICGDISVSRAFGDVRFKTRKNEMLSKGVKEGRWTEKFVSRVQFKGDLVTSFPDIAVMELGPDVEFILLASDGLWDYIKSSDAIAFVRDQLRQHGDVQLASDALSRAALDRRSQDNISIVIADLGKINWKELPVASPNIFLELTQAFATVGVVSFGIWISSLLV